MDIYNFIENEENVQMFVAKATTFDFSVGSIRKKYDGRIEGSIESSKEAVEVYN